MNLDFTVASSCRVLVGLIETPNIYDFETLKSDHRQNWTSPNLYVGFVNIDTIVKSLPLIVFRVKHNIDIMFTIRVGIVYYRHQLILLLCRLAHSSSLEPLYREWGSHGY